MMNYRQSRHQAMNVRSNNAHSYLNSLKAVRGRSSSNLHVGKMMRPPMRGMNRGHMNAYSPHNMRMR